MDFCPVILWGAHEGEHVGFCFTHDRGMSLLIFPELVSEKLDKTRFLSNIGEDVDGYCQSLTLIMADAQQGERDANPQSQV
jgi:hypothetical protein